MVNKVFSTDSNISRAEYGCSIFYRSLRIICGFNIFMTLVCGGGVWFDQTKAGKETIENAQVFQLGMKLARLQMEVEEKECK